MNSPINQRFIQQLPFELTILGRKVQLKLNSKSEIKAIPDQTINESAFRRAFKRWDDRKYLWDSSVEKANRTAIRSHFNDEKISAKFLQFTFREPIGIKLLLFDESPKRAVYNCRHIAIEQMCLTWLALSFNEKTVDGSLTHAIPCAGYMSKIPKYLSFPENLANGAIVDVLCSKNVLDDSG
ncbi:hypothetical protein AB1L42_21835 [Thalassoglobus sp. JC818]|uniref:hypothetical protein n=1 Tax=Thalassoglobus sp. JC818 TaxID=3232136 RepID=UPI00345768EA